VLIGEGIQEHYDFVSEILIAVVLELLMTEIYEELHCKWLKCHEVLTDFYENTTVIRITVPEALGLVLLIEGLTKYGAEMV
jgi:hemoglobin-like flavoprotein